MVREGGASRPLAFCMEMHANQLAVSADTVRALVDAQFPQWRGLEIRPLPTQGTVNALFRIGERLVARFPLQRGDAAQPRREAAAARELLGRTRFATPEPVALGEPGEGYLMPWSVQTWIEGEVATPDEPAGSIAFAHDLAELIGDLRALDTRGRTFRGAGRGGHLPDHDEWVAACLRRSEKLDVPPLRRLWAGFRELPRRGGDVMAHGDLIPGNVLVAGRRLAGVLDVGGFGPADPALDLVAAWHLLEAEPRAALRADLASDDLEWARGMAWAFEQAIGLVWYYERTNPAMAALGRRTLQRLGLAVRPETR
jgi:aminoglycoside phosphotransferase (APT) family kinase protein